MPLPVQRVKDERNTEVTEGIGGNRGEENWTGWEQDSFPIQFPFLCPLMSSVASVFAFCIRRKRQRAGRARYR